MRKSVNLTTLNLVSYCLKCYNYSVCESAQIKCGNNEVYHGGKESSQIQKKAESSSNYIWNSAGIYCVLYSYIFTAVALRQEEVYNSSYSGDINYYQREGTRVMTGDTVYTVDETGRVSDILAQYTSGDGNALSDENLTVIKNTLTNYKTE